MGRTTVGHDPIVDGLIADRMDETAGYRTIRKQGSASWLLFISLSGRGRWSTEGEEGTVGPGEALLLPPLKPQDYGAGGPSWSFYYAHFHPLAHWSDLLTWRTTEVKDPRIEPRCLEMIGLARGQRRLAMNALEEVLIRLSPPHGPRRDSRIEAAIAYINVHLDEPLDIPILAKRAGLSPDRFSKLFLQEVGEGPRDFIEACRLDHAERLLAATALPVSRISEACGFAHPFYFAARFKKRHGLSPSAWRSRE